MVAESREQEEEAFVESRKSNFGAQFDDFQGKFFLATHMLLYSAETWNMTLVNRKKLEAAHRRWLRKILRISWVDRVTNEEVRWRTGQESLETIIRRWRLRWFGHIHRMSASRLAHQALKGDHERVGNRQSKKTWLCWAWPGTKLKKLKKRLKTVKSGDAVLPDVLPEHVDRWTKV